MTNVIEMMPAKPEAAPSYKFTPFCLVMTVACALLAAYIVFTGLTAAIMIVGSWL